MRSRIAPRAASSAAAVRCSWTVRSITSGALPHDRPADRPPRQCFHPWAQRWTGCSHRAQMNWDFAMSASSTSTGRPRRVLPDLRPSPLQGVRAAGSLRAWWNWKTRRAQTTVGLVPVRVRSPAARTTSCGRSDVATHGRFTKAVEDGPAPFGASSWGADAGPDEGRTCRSDGPTAAVEASRAARCADRAISTGGPPSPRSSVGQSASLRSWRSRVRAAPRAPPGCLYAGAATTSRGEQRARRVHRRAPRRCRTRPLGMGCRSSGRRTDGRCTGDRAVGRSRGRAAGPERP